MTSEAWDGQIKNFAVNAESDGMLISFGASVFLHDGRFPVQTFFITRKSLGGHAKKSNFAIVEVGQILFGVWT